jgi:hypothetical protein
MMALVGVNISGIPGPPLGPSYLQSKGDQEDIDNVVQQTHGSCDTWQEQEQLCQEYVGQAQQGPSVSPLKHCLLPLLLLLLLQPWWPQPGNNRLRNDDSSLPDDDHLAPELLCVLGQRINHVLLTVKAQRLHTAQQASHTGR